MSMMLLRFRGPDGTFRLTVNPSDDFGSLLSKVCMLLLLELIRSEC